MDKSTWGDGEWQSEPDYYSEKYNGLEILMQRGPSGAWCGYVKVPVDNQFIKDHSLDKTNSSYDEYDCCYDAWNEINDAKGERLFNTHGGFTYHDKNNEYITVGFDCAHSGDIMPNLEDTHRNLIRAGYKSLVGKLRNLSKNQSNPTYKNLEYVKKECRDIIDVIQINNPQ